MSAEELEAGRLDAERGALEAFRVMKIAERIFAGKLGLARQLQDELDGRRAKQ